MIEDTALVWFGIRARRADLRGPSKLHEAASRRKSFAAGIQQFEEQFAAAKVVSPFTRPLNLYYGLVQAGLAIRAAYAPNPWTFGRHGLKVVDMKPDLAAIRVRPDSEGAFQALAETTGSPIIDGEVSLGALWASLPDLSQASALTESKFPIPLRVEVHNGTGGRPDAARFFTDGVPHFLDADASVYVDASLPVEMEARTAWLKQLKETYPGAQGALLQNHEQHSFRAIAERRFEARLYWSNSDRPESMSEAELEAFFDARAPQYRYYHERYLRPSVEGDVKPSPSPLMTWWLMLYTFSMLARYQPAKWVDLLNVDKSKHAVSLEYALHTALEVVPQLVLEALDQKPFLFTMPMRL